MRSSGPPIDPSLAMVYRQAREAAGSPVSETDSWTLELLVGVDSGLEVLDGPRPGSDPQRIAETVGDRTVPPPFGLVPRGRRRPGPGIARLVAG